MRLSPFESWPVQNEVIASLYERLGRDEIPHAMLFVGNGEDTERLTEYLGRVLLCSGNSAPCGTCEACVQMAAGVHPDYSVVQVSDSGTLKAAQIESVQEQLMLRAHSGGRTVYVLRGVDAMTPVAANRLLKTLEEPVPSVIALLTANHTGRILPTILSRCFIFRLSQGELETAWDDPFPALPNTAGDAAENVTFAGVLKPVVQWAEKLIAGHELPFVHADSFLKISSDIDLSDMLHILSVWFRDVMHVSAGDEQYVRFREYLEDLRRQAQNVSPKQMAECIRLVVAARARLQSHVASLLNLEQMCIRLQEVL